MMDDRLSQWRLRRTIECGQQAHAVLPGVSRRLRADNVGRIHLAEAISYRMTGEKLAQAA